MSDLPIWVEALVRVALTVAGAAGIVVLIVLAIEYVPPVVAGIFMAVFLLSLTYMLAYAGVSERRNK